MPDKVTAYRCSFGCRRRLLIDRHAMERHERTCASNPWRRACRTCTHEVVELEWDEQSGTHIPERVCDIDERPEKVAMVVNCRSWFPRPTTRAGDPRVGESQPARGQRVTGPAAEEE